MRAPQAEADDQETGAADAIATLLLAGAAPLGPVGALAVVYLGTMLLTELVTNNAAAALMDCDQLPPLWSTQV